MTQDGGSIDIFDERLTEIKQLLSSLCTELKSPTVPSMCDTSLVRGLLEDAWCGWSQDDVHPVRGNGCIRKGSLPEMRKQASPYPRPT